MKQDIRLLSEPNRLPIKPTHSHFHAKQQKMDQAGASVKTEAPALSFDEAIRQQIERTTAALLPQPTPYAASDDDFEEVYYSQYDDGYDVPSWNE